MKALIISDLHHGHNISDYHINYDLGVMDWIIQTAKEKKVDVVINTGDTHDKMLQANIRIINLFKQKHAELAEAVDNYYIISGNHDNYYKTSNDVTSLPLFFNEKNQHLIESQPLKVDNLCFIPWISPANSQQIKDFVSKNNSPENYLLAHLEMSGFRNGMITTKTDNLYKAEYNKYAKVFSGHYHEKQERGNLMYVGNPFQKTFGELERKWIHVLDTETGEIEAIENTRTIYRRIEVADGLSKEELEDVLSDVEGKKLRVHIDSSDYKYVGAVEMMLEERKPEYYKLFTKNMVEEHEEIVIDRQSNDELNRDFLENMQYPNEKYKEDFQKLFNETWRMER